MALPQVRGVSGGERKRVNIGVELIKDPNILFLDEPTSGLDSFQALSVIAAIKVLTRNGRTVVGSLHQPRSAIFAMFDQLHLLSEGKTVYFGPAQVRTPGNERLLYCNIANMLGMNTITGGSGLFHPARL